MCSCTSYEAVCHGKGSRQRRTNKSMKKSEKRSRVQVSKSSPRASLVSLLSVLPLLFLTVYQRNSPSTSTMFASWALKSNPTMTSYEISSPKCSRTSGRPTTACSTGCCSTTAQDRLPHRPRIQLTDICLRLAEGLAAGEDIEPALSLPAPLDKAREEVADQDSWILL